MDDGEAVSGADERWSISEAVRKHYAIGPAPASAAWHRPLGCGEGAGFVAFNVAFGASKSAVRATPQATGAACVAIAARLMAAPGFAVPRKGAKTC
jgi:hypothetical protein